MNSTFFTENEDLNEIIFINCSIPIIASITYIGVYKYKYLARPSNNRVKSVSPIIDKYATEYLESNFLKIAPIVKNKIINIHKNCITFVNT